MNFTKPAINIQEQIDKLKGRGLEIKDEAKAASYLSNISYYRLRAYTFPFQDNATNLHPFTTKISFEEIINLYVFDRKLRALIFDAIEKIEISLRTQIIYHWAIQYGSHWQLDPALCRNGVGFATNYSKLTAEIGRSKETFIAHYNNKYTNPSDPPCWMSFEVCSFGLLSMIFSNLKTGTQKKAVVHYYGLKDESVLESWMHSFSNIRNVCAHHGRLWNRRFTAHIKLPTYPKFNFIQDKTILKYKIYAAMACIQYILNIISPTCGFKNKLLELMNDCPHANEKEMGFPKNWQDDPFWKEA